MCHFLTKNNYREHIKRVKFSKIFDVFEENVDKKENSRKILKALFRPKTLIKRDLIKMAFDCTHFQKRSQKSRQSEENLLVNPSGQLDQDDYHLSG